MLSSPAVRHDTHLWIHNYNPHTFSLVHIPAHAVQEARSVKVSNVQTLTPDLHPLLCKQMEALSMQRILENSTAHAELVTDFNVNAVCKMHN